MASATCTVHALPEEPLVKCVTDITEIKASDGKLYVSAVFDCFDSSVVGLAMDTNMKAPFYSNSWWNISRWGFSVHPCSSSLYRNGHRVVQISFWPTCSRSGRYHGICRLHCSCSAVCHTSGLHPGKAGYTKSLRKMCQLILTKSSYRSGYTVDATIIFARYSAVPWRVSDQLSNGKPLVWLYIKPIWGVFIIQW
mgnify:CR=1 FL=1